jgi:hypothetical protein
MDNSFNLIRTVGSYFIISLFCFLNSLIFSIANLLDKKKYCLFPDSTKIELIDNTEIKEKI